MDDIAIIKLLKKNATGRTASTDQCLSWRLVGKICANVLAGHPEDIEEAIADTFIKIWKNASKLNPKRGSLEGLLIVTARHQAINRLQQLSRSNIVPLDDELLYRPT